MFGQYKRIRNEWEGVLTGKGLSYGGSLARTEATGYGLVYFVQEHLSCHGDSFEGKTVAVSGSGNVAIYATEKAQQLGAKVVTLSDSTGWIHDPAGIDVALVKQIKEVERGRISEYAKRREGVEYHEGRGVWSVPVDIALPCATQNELLIDDAKQLVANGVKIVAEGANMPTTMDATDYLMENGVVFCPGKAANAGGVATSGLGDVAELRAPVVDVRGSGREAAGHHEEHLPRGRRRRPRVRPRGQLRDGRQHRRLQEARRRHAGPGHRVAQQQDAENTPERRGRKPAEVSAPFASRMQAARCEAPTAKRTRRAAGTRNVLVRRKSPQ